MPGVQHFGKIMSHAVCDPRVASAAELLMERGTVTSECGVGAVLGWIGMLGLYLTRETTDGVLPGDGAIAVAYACRTSELTARAVIDVLLEVKLLQRRTKGLYLSGWEDVYGPVIKSRDRNAKKNKDLRKRGGHAPGHATGHGVGHVTGLEERRDVLSPTEQNISTPPTERAKPVEAPPLNPPASPRDERVLTAGQLGTLRDQLQRCMSPKFPPEVREMAAAAMNGLSVKPFVRWFEMKDMADRIGEAITRSRNEVGEGS